MVNIDIQLMGVVYDMINFDKVYMECLLFP